MHAGKRYTLGAATHVADLHVNREWFLEGNRDLEIGDAADPVLLDDKDEQHRRAARINQLLDGHTGRRGIHGPFRGMPLSAPDPRIREVVSHRFMQAIGFAAMFGGTHMVIHSPFHGWVNPFSFAGDPVDVERSIELIRQTLAPVFPVAEHHGVLMVMENIFDLNCYPVRRTMETIAHPNLRMSLDVGHAELHVPQGGMPNDQFIRESAKWLEHLHIQDTDALHDRHWAPGDGLVNFHSIFEALRLVDGDPRMIIELKDKTAVQRGAAHLTERGWGQ